MENFDDFDELSTMDSEDGVVEKKKAPHLFIPGDVRYDLNANAYDGVILAITCFMDPGYVRNHGVGATLLQVVMTVVLLGLSVIIEFMLIFMLLITNAQMIEDEFRHNIVNETIALEKAVSAVPPVQLANGALGTEHCTSGKALQTLPFAHHLIIFLWGSKMMSEFVDVAWRFALVCNMPVASAENDFELLNENDNGDVVITHQTHCSKLCMLFCDIFPQALIATFLYWTGAKFLFFAQNMGVLIMKCISLYFIVSIDELLFSAFAGLRLKMRMKRSHVMYRVERPPWNWSMWGASLTKITVVIVLVILVQEVVFRDVTSLRRLCLRYFAAFPESRPIRGGDNLFTSLMKGLDLYRGEI